MKIRDNFEYEFDPAEERVISGVALGAKVASIAMLALGVLYGVVILLNIDLILESISSASKMRRYLAFRDGKQTQMWDAFAALLSAPVYLVLGATLIKGAGHLRAIVETEGEDIANLLSAMSRMSTYFKIMGATCLLVLAWTLISTTLIAAMM